MAKCHVCGKELIEGAAYCPYCGTAVSSVADRGLQFAFSESQPQRSAPLSAGPRQLIGFGKGLASNEPRPSAALHQLNGVGASAPSGPFQPGGNVIRQSVYSGALHKCPSCGEVLESFASFCPACGHELRNIAVSSVVVAFGEQLKQTLPGANRAALIRGFPVPNAREDIIEFMILASANMANCDDDDELESWRAKLDQCYKKAALSFGGSESFRQVSELYHRAVFEDGEEEAERSLKRILEPAMHPLVIAIAALLALFTLIRLFSGEFAGIDIIFDALILWIAFKSAKKLQGEK